MSIRSINCYYNYINYYINLNINNKITNKYIYCFTCTCIPNINLFDYIIKIFTNIYNTNIDIIVLYSIAILNMLKNNGIYLTKYNCHRLVLVSLMIANKIYEDIPQPNSIWALYGGTTVNDINNMEKCLLFNINYKLYISKEQLLSIHKSIY